MGVETLIRRACLIVATTAVSSPSCASVAPDEEVPASELNSTGEEAVYVVEGASSDEIMGGELRVMLFAGRAGLCVDGTAAVVEEEEKEAD